MEYDQHHGGDVHSGVSGLRRPGFKSTQSYRLYELMVN